MKAITICLYTCGCLMIVAAVVGSVDYVKANKNGTLKNLYKEEKPIEHPVVNKEIDYDDYSRGEINRP